MTKRVNMGSFQRIGGIKKIRYCKSCGKRMVVDNFNRMLCKECGYRESRNRKKIVIE
jgi:predicted RNA-binding Zn-ribbon protein involved in translation (DUF1610 family)